MKTTKLLFLLFILIPGLPVILNAQDENFDAVYLSLTREYTLNPDGSMDYRYVKKQKLQTYRAFHNLYGETFVVYNPEFQKLKINGVYTIMADGRKVMAPSNAFNEVLPAFAANAPAYNGLREMVITHTGLERNAEINLDYVIKSAAGFYPVLSGYEILAEQEPVKELMISVKIPAGKKLYFKTYNTAVQPIKTTDGAFDVYSWKLTNVPALSPEEGQPGGNVLAPGLVFSTSGDGREVFTQLTKQEAFRFETDESMRKTLSGIMTDLKDPFSVALKLQELVVNEIRLFPVPLRYTGFKVRTATQTWNSNGGTVAEKAILLNTLLNAAGIKASPVAVVRTQYLDDGIGTLACIEDLLVKVELKEQGTLYLSLTSLNSQNLFYSNSGKTFVTLTGDQISFSRAEESKSKVKLQGTFILSGDPKITGEISIRLESAANPFLGVSRDKNRIKSGLSGSITGADVTDIKVSNITPESSFQSYTLMSNKPLRKDTVYYFFTIPYYAPGIESWHIKTLSAKREAAYEIPARAEESADFEWTLPSSIVVFNAETRVAISNKAGSFNFELRVFEGKLKVRREIRLKELIYMPDEYKDFKTLMDNWNNPQFREIVFKSVK
jgi:hypothetical protein